MILVDTNVLLDVLEHDPHWADWSVGQLRSQSQVHELSINPVIHHAAVLGCAILTRDPARYRTYFPRVALIAPSPAA